MSMDLREREMTLGDRVMARLDALARYSAEDGALTRLYLTPAHRDAAQAVMGWMQEAGLDTTLDAAGSVVGRLPGGEGPRLILGSHIDTVVNGGRYDGPLGVIVAIEALAELQRRGVALPFPVDVLAFGDEEGVRFPVTLTGSRALAGTLGPDWLAARDAEGISLGDALTAFGCDPAGLAGLARDPAEVGAYVEVHIEQGPVLEATDRPVGIVSGIAGATRATIVVTGMAGHAGTVPMALRRDALAGAAEMVLAVEELAQETDDLVATVGQIEVRPGAVNVIAGTARFTIDVRSTDDAVRNAAMEALQHRFEAIATRRGLSLAIDVGYRQPAATCAPQLRQALAAAVAAEGVEPIELPSGAGHDGLAMIALCPIAMLFVRCRGGISHHPAEAITPADADMATRVLIQFLEAYAGSSPAGPAKA
ncbi:allantoate amidohydrolase [Aureimonas frigidaquae]|uniref:allantoate amidohydrolase n=1 Tax=Aureimonas frigidaquae TaxID=424757 RepID=UPI000AB49143|nr:allantoate amidohydrolase [Aureimonas frigidaquae]